MLVTIAVVYVKSRQCQQPNIFIASKTWPTGGTNNIPMFKSSYLWLNISLGIIPMYVVDMLAAVGRVYLGYSFSYLSALKPVSYEDHFWYFIKSSRNFLML